MTEQSRPEEPGGPADPWGPTGPGYWGPPNQPYVYPAPSPPYGHPAPWSAPGYPWPSVPWYDPGDPLVNPAGLGFGGWFERVAGAIRRGWRLLLAIALITYFLPTVAVSLVQLAYGPAGSLPTVPPSTPEGEPPQLPDGFFIDLAVFGGASIAAAIVALLVQSVGWAAGTWAVTRQAVGQPASLGSALAYGVRRALGLWAWLLLSGLIVLGGLCFCVLPGIYLGFALGLVGPVFLFERRNPLGRSFGLFHNRFGLVLGRLALLAAVAIIGGLATSMLAQLGTLATGGDPFGPVVFSVGSALAYSLSAVLSVPIAVVLLAGLLVTYAEQRGHEARTTASSLAAELG